MDTTKSAKAIVAHCILPIDELRVGDMVILCLRVSGRTQQLAGNLDDQELHLRQVAAERGAKIISVFRRVGPGWNVDWLIPAIDMAKQCEARLLAESVSRFVRSASYHPSRAPNALRSEEELNLFCSIIEGVPLITILSPDAAPADERGFQTKRGQEAKNRCGGRPTKKRPGAIKARRINQQPRARQLRAEGRSLAEIAKATGVPRPTIQRWVT